jgi:transposase
MPHKRDLVKEKYWRGLLRQARRSGLTARQFCDQQGISQPSFYAWRREIALRDQQATTTPQATNPTFVKLAVEAEAPSAVEIVLADGRLLRVRSGCDLELLRQLLRLLEEPSC